MFWNQATLLWHKISKQFNICFREKKVFPPKTFSGKDAGINMLFKIYV
jgi:hypothetical protein